MTQPNTTPIKDESIEVVTVYTPHEANTYLLDEYLENPTKAKVIKQLKYQKPPVVRIDTIKSNQSKGNDNG